MRFAKLKKVLAGMLAAIMVMTMFSGVAMADETDPGYNPVDSYVINFSGWEDDERFENYDAKAPLLFQTSHWGEIRYIKDGKIVWSYAGAEVMNLINTVKLTSTPEADRVGPYASLAAYCVDCYVNASGHEGIDYVRLNLEDASYFVEGAAGRVRAIYMNSIPYVKDIADIQDAVNAWLLSKDPDAVLLTDLTVSESISATQMAIWTTVHGSDAWIHDIYRYTSGGTEESLREFICYPLGEYYGANALEPAKSTTEYNMQMMFDYLKALDPVAPASVVVSEASFVNKEMMVAVNTDNTYTITVKTTADVAMEDGDSLVLSAKLGDSIQNVQMKNGKHEYTFTFEKVAALADVTLEINGVQYASDVFFFSPKGGRWESQSMVASDTSRLPVHAETKINVDREINFIKTTSIANAEGVAVTYPLEGIEFEIYYAGTVDEYTQWTQENGREVVTETEENGKKVVTVDAEYAAAAKAKGLVTTVTTDATGKASFNVTKAGQPDGMYLIVEKEHPAIVEALPAFLVAVPTTSPDGSGLTYTVNLHPKNEVYPGPEVVKDITEIGKDLDSVAIGEAITWILRGEVPVDMAYGKSYVMTDTMDYRLTYKNVVKVAAENGEDSVALAADEDYILTVGKSKDAEGRMIDIFEVALTKAGMEKVGKAAGDAYEAWEVRVYFEAIIDEDADKAAGALIVNDVDLEYENSVGIEFFDEEDAKVFTCAIEVLKYDAKDETKLLGGAMFKVAKVVAQDTEGAVQLVTEKGKAEWVVYEEFYNTDEINVDDPATEEVDEATKKVNFVVTSDEEGKKGEAMIYGLAAGEYYLVETKAPAGYNLLSYPIKVTVGTAVDAETQEVVLSAADAISEVKVANSNTFKLPETGGIGTIIFTVSGGLMTLAGGTILALKKKEEE